MLEDEPLFYFYTKLSDIANESFGEKISETTLIKKNCKVSSKQV